MRKIISKIAATFAILGVVAVVISYLFFESGYIFFWIGVGVVVISGIAYLATGEKIKDWFWKVLDLI